MDTQNTTNAMDQEAFGHVLYQKTFYNLSRDVLTAQSLTIGILGYLILVQALRRYHLWRLQNIARPYLARPYDMPYTVARDIIRITLGYEFPLMYLISMQLALLKTYAVGAEGTSLLIQTRQLSCPAYVGRRIEDTGLILAEIMFHGPHSDRGSKTLARLNWLHRRYGSRITQIGYLHTLSMFILQPIDFLNANEWRKLTTIEEVALFVIWRDIGLAMGIENIPENLEELRVWRLDFDQTHLEYSDSGKLLADVSLDQYARVFKTPTFARDTMMGLYAAGLDEKHRNGIGMGPPTLNQVRLSEILIALKTAFSKYLLLPRFVCAIQMGTEGRDGRLHRHQWVNEPWYVEETFFVKVRKFLSSPGAVLPGPAFKSQGYLPEELGPAKYEQQGREEIFHEADQIREYARLSPATGPRCPFQRSP